MPSFIFKRCGGQSLESAVPPPRRPICEDERQYLSEGAQAWTTLEPVTRRFTDTFRQYGSNLLGIGTGPRFAIGQRAMPLRSTEDNLPWDCISARTFASH